MSVTIDDVIEAEGTLSDAERSRLAELESVIDEGVRTFLRTGRALLEVQASRLYRAEFATFEDYFRERWDLKRPRAYELMQAATVHEVMSEISDTPPARESHLAALADLRDQPQRMAEVWESATATAEARDRPVTAADIREARKLVVGPAAGAPAQEPPSRAPAPPAAAGASRGQDERFQLIEDAVSLLRTLPDPEQLAFPSEAGDIEAIGEAVDWLREFTPKLARAWKQHKAATRLQAA